MLNTTEHEKEKKEIIAYIKENSWEIMKDPLTPKRDRLAILLLMFNYKIYRFVWLKYKQTLMEKGSKSL